MHWLVQILHLQFFIHLMFSHHWPFFSFNMESIPKVFLWLIVKRKFIAISSYSKSVQVGLLLLVFVIFNFYTLAIYGKKKCVILILTPNENKKFVSIPLLWSTNKVKGNWAENRYLASILSRKLKHVLFISPVV